MGHYLVLQVFVQKSKLLDKLKILHDDGLFRQFTVITIHPVGNLDVCTKFHPTFHSKPQILTSWWYKMYEAIHQVHQVTIFHCTSEHFDLLVAIVKVIQVHPLGAMNIYQT